MKTPPDMREFARLNQLWLDGMATAEEAASHWRMVAEHAGCAKELAAAARFEALLEQKLSETTRETKALGVLEALPGREVAPVTVWKGALKPMLKAAAVVAVGGLLWWVLGRDGGEGESVQRVASRRVNPQEVKVPVRLPGENVPKAEAAPAVAVTGAAGQWTVEALRSWLDGYFLRGVDLQQVTLQEALGRLQADMMAVNFLGADVVGRLRVTVSADAAGRRVSLRSGAISFLKAVQTLAAQAGCEVEVGELLLAVESKPQPFPQPTARHDLREVLAGRFDANGVAEADRPDLMAKVWADAVEQGFVAADAVGTGPVRLTQGQVDTLKGLAEARAQMDQLPAQEYQLRMVAAAAGYGPGRALEAGEVRQILAQAASEGSVKVEVKPGQRVPVNGEGAGMSGVELEIMPVGQGWQVGLLAGNAQPNLVPPGGINLAGGGVVGDAASQLNSNAVVAAAPVIVMSGQGAVMDVTGGGLKAMSIGSDASLSSAVAGSLQLASRADAFQASTSAGQVLLLPVNPTEGTPP